MRARLTLLLTVVLAGLALAPSAHAGISPGEARHWHPDSEAAERYAKSRSTEVSFAIYDMRDRLSAHEGSRSYIMASDVQGDAPGRLPPAGLGGGPQPHRR